MNNFNLDLSKYKGRTQVTAEEYDAFILWYMKREHIRVLKVKDKVGHRIAIDKKTKEHVSETVSRRGNTGYVIDDKFYNEWKSDLL